MQRMRLSALLSLCLGLSACAAGGLGGGSGSEPETITGTFELVRIEGRLRPLEAPPADTAACAAPSGSGRVEFGSEAPTFRLSVVQRGGCGVEVRRSERGRYIRHGEHLVLEAPAGGTSHTRFRGTTNDTTLTLRLTRAELHFRRVGPPPAGGPAVASAPDTTRARRAPR